MIALRESFFELNPRRVEERVVISTAEIDLEVVDTPLAVCFCVNGFVAVRCRAARARLRCLRCVQSKSEVLSVHVGGKNLHSAWKAEGGTQLAVRTARFVVPAIIDVDLRVALRAKAERSEECRVRSDIRFVDVAVERVPRAPAHRWKARQCRRRS